MPKQELIKDLPTNGDAQAKVKNNIQRLYNLINEKKVIDEDIKVVKEEIKEWGVCPAWAMAIANARWDSMHNGDEANEKARQKVEFINQADEVFE